MKAVIAILTITISLAVFGQHTVNDTMNTSMDEYLKRLHSNRDFNGTVLITKGDTVLYSKSIGLANRTTQTPNNDSTKFLIGSITKPFTAMAILLLEKQEKLSLEDKLSNYFPDFHSSDKITIAQLLTHSSGISDYKVLSDWYSDSKSDKTTPYITVEKMKDLPLLFEPGESFRYSNVGYILLGLIIEKASGQSFSTYLQKNILTPLELNNTGVVDNKNTVPNLALGYTSNPREILKAEYINYLQPFSSGNMYSTADDLRKFTKAVMEGKLLSKAKTDEIFQSGKYYGYGWGIRDFEGVKAYGHYGGMNGFISAITYIPEGKYFVCILTNDDNTPKVRITTDLISILQGKEVELHASTKLIYLNGKIKNQIIGNYLVKEGDTLKVFDRNGKLYLQENGQEKHEMFAFAKYKFSHGLLEFNTVFEDIKNGKARLLKLEGSKTILTAKRISK